MSTQPLAFISLVYMAKQQGIFQLTSQHSER